MMVGAKLRVQLKKEFAAQDAAKAAAKAAAAKLAAEAAKDVAAHEAARLARIREVAMARAKALAPTAPAPVAPLPKYWIKGAGEDWGNGPRSPGYEFFSDTLPSWAEGLPLPAFKTFGRSGAMNGPSPAWERVERFAHREAALPVVEAKRLAPSAQPDVRVSARPSLWGRA